jgi:hypothetical protein
MVCVAVVPKGTGAEIFVHFRAGFEGGFPLAPFRLETNPGRGFG